MTPDISLVAKLTTFEILEVRGTSSEVLSAKKYVVPADSPDTVMDSNSPAVCGLDVPVASVAEEKFAAVISEVEYRTSYDVACPVLPSSPGAVQERSIELDVAPEAARSVVSAGAVVSATTVAAVVVLGTLDIADSFPASSVVLIAKKYSVSELSPEIVIVSVVLAVCGLDVPVASVALAQLLSFMVAVEYLTLYEVEVPVSPSSPGAVQVSPTEVSAVVDTVRSSIVPGAVTSSVAKLSILDISDTFPTSSVVLIAK
jgi:hypothetical protein